MHHVIGRTEGDVPLKVVQEDEADMIVPTLHEVEKEGDNMSPV